MKNIFRFSFVVCCLFSGTNILQAQWTPINSGLTHTTIKALAVQKANLYAGTAGGGVFRSTNYGASWTYTGLAQRDVTALAVCDTILFAGTTDGIFRSTNNGATWTAVNTGLVSKEVTCLLVSGTTIFAGTNGGGIFYTTDYGASWSPDTAGLTNNNITALAVSMGHVYAGTNGGGVFRFPRGASAWIPVNNGLTNKYVTSLVVFQDAIFAGTNDSGVFFSAAYGSSWQKKNLGLPSLNIRSLLLCGTEIFAGTDGGISLCTGFGQEWRTVYTSAQGGAVRALFIAGSHLIAAPSGGGLWKRALSEMITVTPPSSPIQLQPADQAKGVSSNVLFAWTDINDEASYQFQLSTDLFFSSLLVDTSGMTSVSLIEKGLTKGRNYYWRVRVTSATGTSDWSPAASFQTANEINVPGHYSTIQEALNAAKYGDTVLVQPGRYKENIIWPRVNGIRLISAGDSANTIIDGQKSNTVLTFESNNIIDSNTVVCGFKIMNGKGGAFGGIEIWTSSPTISNCWITQNSTEGRGGGVAFLGSRSKLKNVLIDYNSAMNDGGGIACYENVNIEVSNSVIAHNSVAWWKGGGIYFNGDGSSRFSNVVIAENSAGDGGGMSFDNLNTAIFDRVSVIGNSAAREGGAVFFKMNTAPVLTNCTFANNSANGQYDGIYVSERSASNMSKITHSNFLSNGKAYGNVDEFYIADARSNWWGEASGPYHVSNNPVGKGDSVGAYVNFLPFLTSPDTTAPPLPVRNVKVVSSTNHSITIRWDPSPLGDLAGYAVYYGTDSTTWSGASCVKIGNATSATINGLSNGVQYFMTVTCLDKNGDESWFSKRLSAAAIPPVLVLGTTSLSFDGVVIGDSLTHTVVIHSGNDVPLQVSSVTYALPVFTASTPLPTIVEGKGTATIPVKFSPRSFGDFYDTLIIASDGGVEKVPIAGHSPYPVVTLNAESFDFGVVAPNTPVTRSVKIRNFSINRLLIDSMYTHSYLFTASKIKGSVNEGDSLIVSVEVLLDKFGTFSDTLYIKNNSKASLIKIPLTVRSTFQTIFTGHWVDFGSIAVADSSRRVLKLANIFNSNTTIDSIYTRSNAFIVTPKSARLLLQDSLTLSISFKPTSFQTFIDTVYIQNLQYRTILQVSVTGNSPSPTANVSATQIQFGKTRKDSVIQRTVSVSNESINNLIIDSTYTLTKIFKIKSATRGSVVRHGDSVSVIVSFLADSIGSFLDTLCIRNNSLNGLLKIPLAGSATSTTGIAGSGEVIPQEFTLNQNYPNPFNPSTTISFGLPTRALVSLTIFNTLGAEVSTLVRDELPAGVYTQRWDASRYPSGVYFYRLQAGAYTETKRLMLLK